MGNYIYDIALQAFKTFAIMFDSITVNPHINLTLFQPFDKENLMRYLNDPEIYQNTSRIPYPYTEKDADEWLNLVEDNRQRLGAPTNWAIRHRNAGLIGGIGRFAKSGLEGHFDEIGYWLAAPYRGQGLMSEVVSSFSDWLFANSALKRIEAWVFPFNVASIRVLEKSGYDREGYARKRVNKNGTLYDAVLLAKIKA